MPEEIIESFSISRFDILDEKGNVDSSHMPSLSDAEIKRMYELLILSRTFDHYALNLQREGRLGTYASILGQEASQVGTHPHAVGAAMAAKYKGDKIQDKRGSRSMETKRPYPEIEIIHREKWTLDRTVSKRG